MDISYGVATKDDIQRICEMSDDLICRYENFCKVNKDKALGLTHLNIAQNIDKFSTILVNGHKAGYLLMTLKDGTYEIHDLYIEEKYQNQGIGTKVIEQCIKDTGGNIQVFVFTGDVDTYSLFEKLGFRSEKVLARTRYLMRYYQEVSEDTEEFEQLFDSGDE